MARNVIRVKKGKSIAQCPTLLPVAQTTRLSLAPPHPDPPPAHAPRTSRAPCEEQKQEWPRLHYSARKLRPAVSGRQALLTWGAGLQESWAPARGKPDGYRVPCKSSSVTWVPESIQTRCRSQTPLLKHDSWSVPPKKPNIAAFPPFSFKPLTTPTPNSYVQ